MRFCQGFFSFLTFYIKPNYSLSRWLKSPTAQLCAMGRYKSTAPMSHSSTVNNFSSPRDFGYDQNFTCVSLRMTKGRWQKSLIFDGGIVLNNKSYNQVFMGFFNIINLIFVLKKLLLLKDNPSVAPRQLPLHK